VTLVIADCRLQIADRRIADWGLSIDELSIANCLPHPAVVATNRQSSIRRSAIGNLQSGNRQSAIGIRQLLDSQLPRM